MLHCNSAFNNQQPWRKRAIQVLEFFDRVGFTRRVRDAHLLRPGTALFSQESGGTG